VKNLPSTILLDYSLKNDNNKHLEVLAEELGHHFTSFGNSICVNTYFDKLNVLKCEYKADKWATDTLISDSEIINLINNGVVCVYEMAEILEVPFEVLIKKFTYLSKKNQFLNLGNDRYLLLTNLPNLIIYNQIL
jgi:hypothetical protein